MINFGGFFRFPGLPNKAKSSFTGNGLNDSYAGDISSFIIKARDRIGNPIVSELNLLNVTIIMKGSIALLVNTSRVEGYPGTFVVGYRTYVAGRYTVLIRLMSVLLYQGKKYVYAGDLYSIILKNNFQKWCIISLKSSFLSNLFHKRRL